MAEELPPPTDETTRLTLHKLLDLAAAFDTDQGALPPGAYEIVMNELADLRAVSMVYDDEDPDGTRRVDIGPLMSSVGFLLGLFVEYAAEQTGHDRLAIVSAIRNTVDRAH